MRTLSCGVCERPVTNVPPNVDVVLCAPCATHPSLVNAFRDGRARLYEREMDQHHATADEA